MHYCNYPLFLLLCFCVLPSFSQQQLALRGAVVDEDTKEPIPFASIRLTASGRVTISNSEGKFRLNLDEEVLQDSAEVSCIGYESTVFPLGNLSSTEITPIVLKKAVVELKQLVVTNLTPKEIVEKAIQKIPENYVSDQTVLNGFYWSASRENGRFVRLFEAFSQVNFNRYINEIPEVSYSNVRKSKDYRRFKNEEANLLESALSFDHVQEKKGFLNPLNLDLWQYELVGLTQQNKQDIFIIEARFIANPEVVEHKATIYLATESYAILKVRYQYAWYKKHPYFYNDSLSLSDVSWQGTFLYDKLQGEQKYFLKYFTFRNKKELLQKNHLCIAELEEFNECFVQELNPHPWERQDIKSSGSYYELGQSRDFNRQPSQNAGAPLETALYRTVLADLGLIKGRAEQPADSLVAE